jgi:hypothetical protein
MTVTVVVLVNGSGPGSRDFGYKDWKLLVGPCANLSGLKSYRYKGCIYKGFSIQRMILLHHLEYFVKFQEILTKNREK